MYPFKYKVILSTVLLAAFLLLVYFTFHGFLIIESNSSYLAKVLPYTALFYAVCIIFSPVIFSPNANWLVFFFAAGAIAVISLGLQNPLYNFYTLMLFGISVNVHIFAKRQLDKLEYRLTAIEKIKGATNLIKDKYQKTKNLNMALSDRLKRYNNLREIGELFSAKLSLEEIYELTVATAFRLIPNSDAALLFVVDEEHQKLSLCASKFSTELPRVKSKDGDIFDQWVFKERQPLNIEDMEEDFRFDYKPLHGERYFKSLISVPLISQSRIIGILRLNSRNKNEYSFDDLRLLDFISDLASSVINNARLYRTTEELSTKDSLTGFYIHRYMKERLAIEVKRAAMNGTPLSVIMIDIDHFKDYNDRYGHSAGDKVLLGLARIMRENSRDGFILARYGGEEFMMILPGVKKDAAKELAEDIRRGMASNVFVLRRKDTTVTISAGVTQYSDGMKDDEDIIKKCDFLLYKAKREGRDRVAAD